MFIEAFLRLGLQGIVARAQIQFEETLMVCRELDLDVDSLSTMIIATVVNRYVLCRSSRNACHLRL